MPVLQDSKTGKYVRKHQEWSLANWDDGFFNNKGRFLVYYPTSSKVLYQGYVLRYHAVWEIITGKAVPSGFVLHHLNHDKTDDRFANLQLLEKSEHDALHGRAHQKKIEKKCLICQKLFLIKECRLNDTQQKRGIFCSQICYHKAGGRWYGKIRNRA